MLATFAALAVGCVVVAESAALSAPVGLLLPAAVGASPGAPATVTATADFGTVAQRTSPHALGVVSSTYGATPVTSAAQSTVEQALDARYVRIPVGVRHGVVTSSAGGAGKVDVVGMVAKYRSWGYRILAVIGGRTSDFDVHPGDATTIMTALGFNEVDYSGPNEPNNMGKTVHDAITVASMIINEGTALNPGFTLWGPVWANYNRASIGLYAQNLDSNLGGVDYHDYGMGSTSLSTAAVLAATPAYGQNVVDERADLASFGARQNVNVDEVNLSWRYHDGTSMTDGGDGSGGNHRFFTAVNTVFLASACGHVLVAGGNCMPYATQNGPLGMTVQNGQINPDNRPVSSPMPGYWGIGAWTGAHLWPHMKDSFYPTTSSDAGVEVYAVNNEAGGKNLVLINKSAASAKTLAVALKNLPGGTYTTYQTSPATPYSAPAKIDSGSYTSGGTVTLPAMTVTTVILQPGPVTPPPGTATSYRIAAGDNTIPGYQSPAALVAGGTAASNPGTTTPPAGIPAQVFQAERWGDQTYTLPVGRSNPVTVRLVFAERYQPNQRVGARQFDVAINGVRIATNFDIWTAQGHTLGASTVLTADARPVNATVTITLSNGAAGSPTINAVLLDPAAPPET